MIKKILAIVPVFLFLGISFAYQQQGFTSYQEGYNNSLDFACESQCVVLLGTLGSSDYLDLEGNLEGNGTVGFGFLVGQQIAPGPMININGNGNMSQKFNFSDLQFYSQIPKDANVVLIVQGDVKVSQMAVNVGAFDFWQKIGQAWEDFGTMEPMTPYTINLRYGVKILGTSVVQYGYWIFVILAFYLRFFSKKHKEERIKRIFFLGIGIFLFIGLRNMITNLNIVEIGIIGYNSNKTLFDLGDYIPFTEAIRKKLNLDIGHSQDCKIQINSFQDRPFKAHWEAVYLKPCKVTITGSEADYIIYYHVPVSSGDTTKQVLVQFNDNYLLNNK